MNISFNILDYLLKSLKKPGVGDINSLPEKIKINKKLCEKIIALESDIKNKYIDVTRFEQKVNSFNEIILKFAQHNYTLQNEIDYDNDLLDSLAISINFLGEELNYSTVTKYYLEDIFNSMETMLIVVDMQGTILFVNNSCLRKLQYKNDDILRKSLSMILDNKISVDLLKHNGVQDNMGFFISKKACRIPVSLTISSFMRGDGKIIGKVIIATDMTSKLKVEAEFEKSKKNYANLEKIKEEIKKNLEREKELNKLKSQFISTVSHEFRTPLTRITSSIQLLEKYDYKWDKKKKKAYYKKISDAVLQAKLLLDNVSLMEKDQEKRICCHPVKVHLPSLINQIWKDIQQIYGEINIEIKYNIKSTYFYLDSIVLTHILENLLSNAVKYSRDNIDISMEITKTVQGELQFIIEDHGIGIPLKDQKYLFESFFRASNTENIKGTGLGLSIVKRFVDILRGSITFKSKEGKGTKVTVKLPFKKM